MQATQPLIETWRPVVGHEDSYEVSDHGRVRSIDRLIPHARYPGHSRLLRGRVLSPALNAGYPAVNLTGHGQRRMAKIHWLVADAFLGGRTPGSVVRHVNGDKTDNRVENLRVGTYSDNNHDTVAHGNHWQARKTRCKNGHEFTPENTILRPEGGRRCRECDIERGRRRYRR